MTTYLNFKNNDIILTFESFDLAFEYIHKNRLNKSEYFLSVEWGVMDNTDYTDPNNENQNVWGLETVNEVFQEWKDDDTEIEFVFDKSDIFFSEIKIKKNQQKYWAHYSTVDKLRFENGYGSSKIMFFLKNLSSYFGNLYRYIYDEEFAKQYAFEKLIKDMIRSSQDFDYFWKFLKSHEKDEFIEK